jgi:hypothetical protein
MTQVTDAIRTIVRDRAAQRCEYCHFPGQLQVGGFEIDHVRPLSKGGPTTLENLAYACPRCNDRKWVHVEFTDPVAGESAPLFHPRQHRWEEHFEWAGLRRCEIVGKTPTGRATVAALRLNDLESVAMRHELIRLGIPVGSHRSV